MQSEDKKKKWREYYEANREKILRKNRKRYRQKVLRERMEASRKRYNEANAEWIKERRKELWAQKNTPEFREKRRQRYAEKHADDPMTEHRRKILDANERKRNQVKMPYQKHELRKGEYEASEEAAAKEQQTIVQFIKYWATRKQLKEGRKLSEPDIQYYRKEAKRYFYLMERYSRTDPSNSSERNIIATNMRTIERKFREIYSKKYEY